MIHFNNFHLNPWVLLHSFLATLLGGLRPVGLVGSRDLLAWAKGFDVTTPSAFILSNVEGLEGIPGEGVDRGAYAGLVLKYRRDLWLVW